MLRGASAGLKSVKAKSATKEGKLFMLSHVPKIVEAPQCHNIQAIQGEEDLPSIVALISQYFCLFEIPSTLQPTKVPMIIKFPLLTRQFLLTKDPIVTPELRKISLKN